MTEIDGLSLLDPPHRRTLPIKLHAVMRDCTRYR